MLSLSLLLFIRFRAEALADEALAESIANSTLRRELVLAWINNGTNPASQVLNEAQKVRRGI